MPTGFKKDDWVAWVTKDSHGVMPNIGQVTGLVNQHGVPIRCYPGNTPVTIPVRAVQLVPMVWADTFKPITEEHHAPKTSTK